MIQLLAKRCFLSNFFMTSASSSHHEMQGRQGIPVKPVNSAYLSHFLWLFPVGNSTKVLARHQSTSNFRNFPLRCTHAALDPMLCGRAAARVVCIFVSNSWLGRFLWMRRSFFPRMASLQKHIQSTSIRCCFDLQPDKEGVARSGLDDSK